MTEGHTNKAYLKKLGIALRQKRGQRGLRELARIIDNPQITPALLSAIENNREFGEEWQQRRAIVIGWLGMTQEQIEAIELPTEQSEAERTAPICLHCKTPLENVRLEHWKETQAVERMVTTEDDGWLEVVDQTFNVEGMVGYCPKCKQKLTQDWFSGLWF